jgi:hypothetical protein
VVVVDDVDVIDVEGRCISEQYAKNITENILLRSSPRHSLAYYP